MNDRIMGAIEAITREMLEVRDDRREHVNMHMHLTEWAARLDSLRALPPSATADRFAYEGAREDLLDWKRRALTAEADLRRLCDEFNRENGPIHMGEPVLQPVSETAAQGSVPEGWKMVPVEPTDEMIEAFAETWFKKRRCIDDPEMSDAYAAMLAAAPLSPEAAATELTHEAERLGMYDAQPMTRG